MVGLAILSGLRRGEFFALRWRDIDEQARLLTVREAVYDGVFSTPKTEAGARRIPLSDTALTLIAEWKAYVEDVKPDALVFSTSAGTPILPNNVVRRFIFPACTRLGLPRSTWLTFGRAYSSWSHDRSARPSTRSAANRSQLFTKPGRRTRGPQRKLLNVCLPTVARLDERCVHLRAFALRWTTSARTGRSEGWCALHDSNVRPPGS